MGVLASPKLRTSSKPTEEVIDLCAIRPGSSTGNSVRILNDTTVVKELEQELAKKPRATVVLLCNNTISGIGAAAVCKLLMKHKIEKLDFSGNQIFNDADNQGAQQLASLLKMQGCTLKHLVINECGLCTENSLSSNLLANALNYNKSLQIFDARSNDINDERFKAFALTLRFNDTLCELDFSNNRITYEMAVQLIQVLNTKHQIVKLALEGNQISAALLEQITQKVNANANASATTKKM